MKRGGPLPRRTPLRSRSQLRQRSDRKVAEERERARLRRKAEEQGPITCAGASPIAQIRPDLRNCWGHLDWHEVLTRKRGGSPIDPTNREWLCRRHHDFVTTHPKEAEEMGLMLPSRR